MGALAGRTGDEIIEGSAAQRELILAAVRADPTIGTVHAARDAGVVGTIKEIRRAIDVDGFGEELRIVRGYGDEQIRRAMYERAIVGVEEPVFQGGVQVGTIRRYSDRLLGMLAKAYLPEFKDRRDVVDNGADVTVQVTRMEVGIADVVKLAEELGVLRDLGIARPGDALPAAREVLPALPVGSAGAVPAARE
jgi:hypothetical protein